MTLVQFQPYQFPSILLEAADAELSIAHLQLLTRTEKSLLKLGVRTIGKLSEEVANGALFKWKLGEVSTTDVERAVRSLSGQLDHQGRVDWPGYWAVLTEQPRNLAFTSIQLESLAAEARELPASTLNLGARAVNSFRYAGILTLGDLLDRLRQGLGKVRNFGALAHQEVVGAITALSKSARADGQVDWIYYAGERGLPVLPKNSSAGDAAPQAFITTLPELARKVVNLQLGEREVTILNKRLLAGAKQRRTLEQIGEVADVTRERIRQLEQKIIDVIRKPLIHDDYEGMKFRFQPGLATPVRQATEHFAKWGVPAWRRDRWVAELASIWRVAEIEVAKNYLLLCKLLGYDEIESKHPQLETLVYHLSTPAKTVDRIVSAVDAIHEALSRNPEGCDDFDLTSLANEYLTAAQKISIDDIPQFTELVSSAEVIGDEIYRLDWAHLGGRANQAVRVLSAQGHPMSKLDIVREINRRRDEGRQPVTVPNFINQIIGDPRLQPIGKSGIWTLTDWGAETRPIIEIIEDCFHTSGEAMTDLEIYQAVAKLRPIAKGSTPLFLRDNPDRFRRVGPHTWALVAWGDKFADDWWDSDEIGKFIERFFNQRSQTRIEFSKLRRALETEFGFSVFSAKGILVHHPAILIEKSGNAERIAVFRAAWRTVQLTPRTNKRRKPLVRDRIAQAIRSKLETETTHELPLIDLVKQVEIEVGVPRPSVYAVVQQSEEFESVAVGTSSYKICRLAGESRAEFPQLEKVQPTKWKRELQRSIEKIDIEDVDIALFVIGRQFEDCMKALLQAADKRGDPPVAEGNKAKLNNMIDWAISRELFVDRGTIHLLRIERNERAHKPPLSERSALLKAAPFLIALYLDYILMIQDRLISWGVLGEVDGKS
jgi:hypothetical protein